MNIIKNYRSSRVPYPSLRIPYLSLRAKRGNLIAFSSHPKIATGLTLLAMTNTRGDKS